MTLGRLTGTAAVPIASACVRADSRELRLTAANVLGAIGGKDARSAVALQLGSETDPEVRVALQRALAKGEP